MEIKLNCPSCKTEIEFTWGKYFKNPFSRFTCHYCGVEYKFNRPKIYYLWVVISFVLYSALLAIGLYLFGIDNILPMYLVSTAIYLAVYFPIDKKIESKYETKLR